MPTFSEEVKMALVNSEFIFPEVELYGIIKGKGNYIIENGKSYLKISLSSINTMKRVYKLCRELFKEWVTTYVKNEKRLNIGKVGEIVLDIEYASKVLKEFGIDLFADEVSDIITSDPVKFGVFLKGLFLTTGSVSLKTSYHLEFYMDVSEAFTESLIRNLSQILGIKSNYIIKSNKIKLYIKSSQDIISTLEIMQAYKEVEKFADVLKVRELKVEVTRTINFISANATKTAESSSKQIHEIMLIDDNLGIDNLPLDLMEVAYHRLQNEDKSIKELADDLNMSKSTLYSKLKKLSKIAKEISGEDSEE